MNSHPALRTGSPAPSPGPAAQRRPRRGASLPLVLGVMVVVSIVGTGLLATSGVARTEAVRRQQSLQCFWHAESALAVARARLYTDPAFRQTPTPIAFTNGLTMGAAVVGRTGSVYTVFAGSSNAYTRQSRRLLQEFVVESYDYWDDFALIAGGDGIGMAQSVSIYGDVFTSGSISMSQSAGIFETLYCLGNLDMSQSAAVSDQAFVGGTVSLRQGSTIYGGYYPFDSPGNPYAASPPQVPAIDWAWYESLLAQAATRDSGLNFNESINLGGTNNFANGSRSLKQVKTLTSTPPGGVLAVNGTFTIQQACQIGSGVTVICADQFRMFQSTRVGSNCIIYARNRIEMKQSGIVATGCSLITPGTIDMKQAAQASGFIYAGDTLDLSQSVVLRGLSFAGRRAILSQSVSIHYNRGVLPFLLPPGLNTNPVVRLHARRWREL